jgi:hypothetical protein
MRPYLHHLLLAAALFGWNYSLRSADALELLPQTKIPVLLSEGERNPFAVKAAPAAQVVAADQESEESRLRGLLANLQVSGYAEGEGGTTVLLGPYLLRPGELVPSLLRRQTEQIRVAAIRPGQIELLFLEPNDRPPTRRLTLNFSTEPKVRYLLGTQVPPVPRTQTLQGVFPPTVPSADESVAPKP